MILSRLGSEETFIQVSVNISIFHFNISTVDHSTHAVIQVHADNLAYTKSYQLSFIPALSKLTYMTNFFILKYCKAHKQRQQQFADCLEVNKLNVNT